MGDRRIVPSEQVPPDERDSVANCFFCYCPKHPQKAKAVVAVETIAPSGRIFFYGICGNHAEVYPFTEEEKARQPMLCPFCFPRGEV